MSNENQRPLCPSRNYLVEESHIIGTEMPDPKELECSGEYCSGPSKTGGYVFRLCGRTIHLGGSNECGMQIPQADQAPTYEPVATLRSSSQAREQ